ncbi:hypothetical protein JCM10908_004072 [Rhodotorula pacifica]|uniref:uncharacterized protein n=1 Tax=Rhodotorula pacifica TaxID=1495444 RepID=UPI0031740874
MFGGGQYPGQGGQGGAGQQQQYYQQQQQQQQQQQMQMQMQMQGLLGGSSAGFAGGQSTPAAPFAAGGQPVSTSGLLQQQLAQQAAAAQNYQAAQQLQNGGRPIPYPNQQPFLQNNQPTAYPPPPFTPQNRSANALGQNTYPGQTPSQASPSMATPTQRSGTQSMSQQDLQMALRGVSLQGMTAERFAQLAPHQQAALRELMARQRAQQQQQAQIGLGTAAATAPHATPLRPPPAAIPTSTPTAAPNRQPPPPMNTAPPASAPPSGPQLAFLKTLADFYAKRGQTFTGPPTIEGRVLDLARMFAAVQQGGGSAAVAANNRWGYVASSLGFGASSPDAHPHDRLAALEEAYQRVLLPFEQYWQQIQRARQNASAGNAASPAANAMSPTMVNGGAVASPAPSPYSVPSPATNSLPNGGQKQTIQARRIERAASEAQNLLQNQNRQAGMAQHTQPAPYTSMNSSINDSSNAARSTLQQAAASTGVATPRQSQSRPRTANSAAPPFAGSPPSQPLANIALHTIKPEEGTEEPVASTSALSNERPSSSSGPRTTQRKKASTSASSVAPAPVQNAAPARRKRRRIEYRPYSKAPDTFGGIEQADHVLVAAERVRQPRQLGDLGLIDIHSLTMSLRCRIPSEVAYALNALAVIALQMSGDAPNSPGVQFPLEKCPELLEELLDLLEETAFGYDDEPRSPSRDDGVGTSSRRDGKATPTSAEEDLRSYRRLFKRAEAELSDFAVPSAEHASMSGSTAELGNSLRPAPTILAVCNLLQNLTTTERNMRFAAEEPRLAEILIRVAALPLRSSDDSDALAASSPYPVRLSAFDLLTIRKTAIEVLSHIALDISLDAYPPTVAAGAIDLILFFLRDADQHKDPYVFGICQALPTLNRISQPHAKLGPQTPTVLPYLGYGLAVCARLFLRDGNRSAVSDLIESDELFETFVSLVALLPIAEKDFQVMTFETGLLYMHSVVVSLYNLVYLCPPSVKARLRRHPKITRAFLRMIRRLAGTQVAYSEDDIYQQIAHRALAILRLLDGGQDRGNGADRSLSKRASTNGTSDLPWYGMSMSGLDDEDSDDSLPDAEPAPPVADGMLVDGEAPASLPPAAMASANIKAPILAGETRQLLEHLLQSAMPLVIPALMGLADGSSSGRKRRS